jgi:putative Mg2+ transporter-C (MgtC) family protein
LCCGWPPPSAWRWGWSGPCAASRPGRTLRLVSFGAALVTLRTSHAAGIQGSVEALSRLLQGVDQGVLVGIGFLGSGIILRDLAQHRILNLTTAAEIWVIAAMGLTTAVAPWPLVGAAVIIMAVLIVLCRMIEKRLHLKDHN